MEATEIRVSGDLTITAAVSCATCTLSISVGGTLRVETSIEVLAMDLVVAAKEVILSGVLSADATHSSGSSRGTEDFRSSARYYADGGGACVAYVRFFCSCRCCYFPSLCFRCCVYHLCVVFFFF